MSSGRLKPPDYEDAWYEEPSDGQWYNSYDWYQVIQSTLPTLYTDMTTMQDDAGQWAYDYRMEEYGYRQTDTGEWVAVGGEGDGPPQTAPTPPRPAQLDKTSTTAGTLHIHLFCCEFCNKIPIG